MKTKKDNEKLIRVTVPFPSELWTKVKKLALINRRSANDEVINILSEYFDGSLVKLDSIIKKIVEITVEKKGFTIAEAVNYLIPIGVKQDAIDSLKTAIDGLAVLQKNIEEYAEKRSISVEQALDDLGINKVCEKGLAEIERKREKTSLTG